MELELLKSVTSGMVTSENHKWNRPVPKPNYQFEKRQREQDKKKKKAEKAQRKAAAPDETHSDMTSEAPPENKPLDPAPL